MATLTAPPAPSRLRNTVVIKRLDETRNSFGEPVQSWVNVLIARAEITLLRAGERFAGGFGSQATHQITIRWPGIAFNIQPGMRAVHGNDVYRIQTVENVEQRNRWIAMQVETLNNQEGQA